MARLMLAETGTWFTKVVGWSWLRRVGFPAIGRAAARLSGVEFFPNRTLLLQQCSFDDLLGKTSKIDAIVVIGRTLHETELKNIRRIERVIFPCPDSTSSLHYAKSVTEQRHFQKNIAEATTSLREKGIQVRWYPHAIHHAVLIADGTSQNGWIQVEAVFPYSKSNLRPIWRAHSKQHEELVRSMQEIFNRMWDGSKSPDEISIKAHIGESHADHVAQ